MKGSTMMMRVTRVPGPLCRASLNLWRLPPPASSDIDPPKKKPARAAGSVSGERRRMYEFVIATRVAFAGRNWFDPRMFDPRLDIQLLVKGFAPSSPLKVLELGHGKGVNAEFFSKRGDDYTGIDRQTDVLRPQFLRYGKFLTGDYSLALPPGPFDLIFDRSGFSFNVDEALQRAVKLAWRELKPGGLFIAADLYAAGNPMNARHPDISRTFTLEYLRELFSEFETLHLVQGPTTRLSTLSAANLDYGASISAAPPKAMSDCCSR
ncbi:MAG: class I SAM-dependent DNA methyltransferase [Candidatus Binataceae bacterium]